MRLRDSHKFGLCRRQTRAMEVSSLVGPSKLKVVIRTVVHSHRSYVIMPTRGLSEMVPLDEDPQTKFRTIRGGAPFSSLPLSGGVEPQGTRVTLRLFPRLFLYLSFVHAP